jgi:hypothetical protein
MEQKDLAFDIELPSAKMLKAGVLTCMYETGNIRYISSGKTEFVRKIYTAVRYENWDTLSLEIYDEKLVINESGFTINYTAIYSKDKDIYKVDYQIEGNANNSISFSMKGTALADFKRNRIGICVHHPIKECSGKKATIVTPDGTTYDAFFPDLVSPVLPFLEVKQLRWITEDGLGVQLDFEGEVFETEDQRNWSDGSFKTYSTRSSVPKPVKVNAGDTIEQKVTISISGGENSHPAILKNDTREVKVPFPQIGYGRSKNGPVINHAIVDFLLKIPFDHYRVIITMNQDEWVKELEDALDEAIWINTRLELVVFFSDNFQHEIEELISRLEKKQLLVQSLLVLKKDANVSSRTMLEQAYPVLKAKLPAVRIGYGTDANFVDVNENRPAATPFDFISFGIQPQAHAFDSRSIIENLQSAAGIMKTAINISGGAPVCISPLTFKDRNSGADERQYSAFVTAWTLMSIQNLGEAYSITCYELFGAAGILKSTEGDNMKAGAIYPSPTYTALAAIFDFQPAFVIKRYTNEDLVMDGLLIENDAGDRLFFKAPREYVEFRCEI